MNIFKSIKIEITPSNFNNVEEVSIKKDEKDLVISYIKDRVQKEKRIELDLEKVYINPKVLNLLRDEKTIEIMSYLLIEGYKRLKYSITEIKIETKANLIILSFNTIFPYDFEINDFKRLQYLSLDLSFTIKGI